MKRIQEKLTNPKIYNGGKHDHAKNSELDKRLIRSTGILYNIHRNKLPRRAFVEACSIVLCFRPTSIEMYLA